MAKSPEDIAREKKQREHRIQRMESDYLPEAPAGATVPPEWRMSAAADYSAYQLGQINRKLGRLIELLEKAEAKKG